MAALPAERDVQVQPERHVGPAPTPARAARRSRRLPASRPRTAGSWRRSNCRLRCDPAVADVAHAGLAHILAFRHAAASRAPLGPAVHEHGRRRGRPLRNRRADREGRAAPTAASSSATCARPQRARDALREIPIAELIAARRPRRRALRERRAPDGRRHRRRPTTSSARSRARPASPSVCAART